MVRPALDSALAPVLSLNLKSLPALVLVTGYSVHLPVVPCRPTVCMGVSLVLSQEWPLGADVQHPSLRSPTYLGQYVRGFQPRYLPRAFLYPQGPFDVQGSYKTGLGRLWLFPELWHST